MFSFLNRRSKTSYRLPDGTYVDPLQCYRKLLQGNLASLIEAYEASAANAEESLCKLLREVFPLDELDSLSGKGYTEEDCLNVYVNFMDYLEKKG